MSRALGWLGRSWRWLCFRARYGRHFKSLPFSTQVGRGVSVSSLCAGPSIEIGPGVRLGDGVWFELGATGRIKLGARTWLTKGCVLSANLSVELGDDCLIGEYSSLRDSDHARRDVPVRDQDVVSERLVLGNGVWIGRGVAVLRGVTIAEGAIVGANAVVTRDLPAFSIAYGVPAVVRGQRP
jgi:acetyltransferase-like isoleucine patch superfamily enzyme